MKKSVRLLSILLLIALLCLSGCSKRTETPEAAPTEAPVEEVTPEPTAEPTPEPTPEPEPEIIVIEEPGEEPAEETVEEIAAQPEEKPAPVVSKVYSYDDIVALLPNVTGSAYAHAIRSGNAVSFEQKIDAIGCSFYAYSYKMEHPLLAGPDYYAYSGHNNTDNETGYYLRFYYADGLPYFVEVINPSTMFSAVKLYYFGSELIAYRDYRTENGSLQDVNGENFAKIANEFAVVFDIAMNERPN